VVVRSLNWKSGPEAPQEGDRFLREDPGERKKIRIGAIKNETKKKKKKRQTKKKTNNKGKERTGKEK